MKSFRGTAKSQMRLRMRFAEHFFHLLSPILAPPESRIVDKGGFYVLTPAWSPTNLLVYLTFCRFTEIRKMALTRADIADRLVMKCDFPKGEAQLFVDDFLKP